MTDPNFDLQKALQNLSPDAQARVQSAVKTAVSQELVSQRGTAPAADASAFSRGWVFSRVSNHLVDQTLLAALPTMNDTQFAAFAQRLSQLKQGGSGG